MRVRTRDVRLFFDVEGTELRLRVASVDSAPTIVIVHDGPGGDHTTFKHRSFGPRLAETAQVVYLDLRGHGRSDRSDTETWNLDTWADDLAGFCDVLGLEAPVVFGSGFGALVATRYGGRHAEQPGRLILSRPVARLDAEQSVAAFERLAGPEGGAAARAFYAAPSSDTYTQFMLVMMSMFRNTQVNEVQDALFRAQWNVELALHWYAREAFEFDLGPDAERIRVPTLVLAGDDDPLMPVEGAVALSERIDPQLVRFVRFPGARHSLYADDAGAMKETLAFLGAEAGP